MSSLREVIISITNRCNFRCRMCDIPRTRLAELSTDQWKGVIGDAAAAGAQAIVFSGGEPLLREDIFELISFVKRRAMGACITSNGYLIDDAVAARLRHAGVDVVNISVEGPKRVHDYLRGRGMFERALAALKHLRVHSVEATIATMVSRYTYKYLGFVLDVAKEHGATTVKFQPYSTLFVARRERGDAFWLRPSDVRRLVAIMDDVIARSRQYAIATNPPAYLELIPYYLGRQPVATDHGCAALEYSCPVNSQGDVFPCWVLADEAHMIGSLRRDSFVRLWDSPHRRSVIERIRQQGCPQCMMSCYDQHFGRESIDKRIAVHLARLHQRGLRRYLGGLVKRWQKRVAFYRSYRGSARDWARRLSRIARTKIPPPAATGKEHIAQAEREIASIQAALSRAAAQQR